jgi:hypothetical protein
VTLGWRYFNRALDPLEQGDRDQIGKEKIDFVGQTAERPYSERQRYPGDYEVQVSQRPNAVHALEHLATSDRGVAKLRRLIRDNIRALAGAAPVVQPQPPGDQLVPTFCQDTVFPVAQQKINEDEKEFLAFFGQRVADTLLENAGDTPEQRIDGMLNMWEKEFVNNN